MSACRIPGWNERVFVRPGSKISFLGLPIIIMLITVQRGDCLSRPRVALLYSIFIILRQT